MHTDNRFLAPLISIETDSPCWAALAMPGKSPRFNSRNSEEIVFEGRNILCDNHWFPLNAFMFGLPNDTDDAMKQPLDLLNPLKNTKVLYVPSFFTTVADTRMPSGRGLSACELRQFQWEFFSKTSNQSPEFSELRDRSRTYFTVASEVLCHPSGSHAHGPSFY